jgi:hypothetical protein
MITGLMTNENAAGGNSCVGLAVKYILTVESLDVKRSGHEADHSPPSNAAVKNSGSISPFPHKSSWRGA